MDFYPLFDGIRNAFFIAISYWWLYWPVLLAVGVVHIWKNYIRTAYLTSLKWVVLEVKPPPDVEKSPKIAENFFSGLHGVYAKPLTEKKQFFEGKVPDWYSFEIAGNQGDVRFYIRTLEDNRNIVETQIFAQYPDAEISVAEDYMQQLPAKIPNDEYDMFGAELVFTKSDAFPIKTYPFFEEESGKDEFKRTDPLAPLAEVLSSLGSGEYMWMQYVARPTGGDWTKDFEAEVAKLAGKTPPPAKLNFLEKILDGVFSLVGFASGEPVKKEEKEFSIQKLTTGQKFTLDQVENKAFKLAFKVTPRLIYIAKKDIFNRSRVSNVIGMFKQLYSNNLNTFKPNKATSTSPDGYFAWLFPSNNGFMKSQEEYKRKIDMYKRARAREFKELVILSTEEIATLFHLPGINVKAPLFPRVEAKKSQPPAGLPIL
ncbi:MAG: hypothetical protein AAB479_00760 [Patescibacteria group bacterium]